MELAVAFVLVVLSLAIMTGIVRTVIANAPRA